MDRREFLARAGLIATWAAIPITLTGCGDDDDKNPSGSGDEGDVEGSVGTAGGHSHTVVITRVQIDAGNAVTLTLAGSGHTHEVSLTAGEVTSIGDDQQVSKQSTSDSGHSHSVTFN